MYFLWKLPGRKQKQYFYLAKFNSGKVNPLSPNSD